MRLYKLTDQNDQTHGKTQWGENVTHETNGEGELCGPGWLHAYQHPLLAALLNPIHANFPQPKLWLAEGEPEKFDSELKLGCRKLTTIKQLALPNLSIEFRVRFAIKCALRVYKDPTFASWADKWLSGEDRSEKAAAEAAWAARAARAAEAKDEKFILQIALEVASELNITWEE